MVPPRPGFAPLSLEFINDRMEMHLFLTSACILYHIYIRDNLLIYQEIWTKYWRGRLAESALKTKFPRYIFVSHFLVRRRFSPSQSRR